MTRIQWSIVGLLATGLLVSPVFADDQATQPGQQAQQPSQQPQEQPFQGKVESTEIGLAQTPAPVRSAIEKWAQGSQVKKVKELRQGTKIQYKVEIERKGSNLQLLLNEQGQVLRSGKDVGVDDGMF